MIRRAPARAVHIGLRDAKLEGVLSLPDEARAAVLFVHGSGSSRLSPRNRFVAGRLVERGLGTRRSSTASGPRASSSWAGRTIPSSNGTGRPSSALRGPKQPVEVPGATHLFEEPGALERVADEAASWFERHLSAA